MSVEKAMEQRIMRQLEARLPLLIAEGVRKELDRQARMSGASNPVAGPPTGGQVSPKMTVPPATKVVKAEAPDTETGV